MGQLRSALDKYCRPRHSQRLLRTCSVGDLFLGGIHPHLRTPRSPADPHSDIAHLAGHSAAAARSSTDSCGRHSPCSMRTGKFGRYGLRDTTAIAIRSGRMHSPIGRPAPFGYGKKQPPHKSCNQPAESRRSNYTWLRPEEQPGLSADHRPGGCADVLLQDRGAGRRRDLGDNNLGAAGRTRPVPGRLHSGETA